MCRLFSALHPPAWKKKIDYETFHTHKRKHTHTHTHIHTYIHTYAHTHTHTHTHIYIYIYIYSMESKLPRILSKWWRGEELVCRTSLRSHPLHACIGGDPPPLLTLFHTSHLIIKNEKEGNKQEIKNNEKVFRLCTCRRGILLGREIKRGREGQREISGERLGRKRTFFLPHQKCEKCFSLRNDINM